MDLKKLKPSRSRSEQPHDQRALLYRKPVPNTNEHVPAVQKTDSWLPPKAFSRPRSHSWDQNFPPFPGRSVLYKTLRYHRLIWSFVILLACIIVPITLITLKLSKSMLDQGNLPFYDCTYTGTFTFRGIDIPYGKMEYAQAKAIDLAWNTIVGRSLQTALAYICYRMFTDVLLRICESEQVSYELFAAISLFPSQWNVFWPTLKAILSGCNKRVRLTMAWILISAIYMALFPTLVDAVSGYQSVSKTLLRLPNATTIDLTDGLWPYLASEPQNFTYQMPPPADVTGNQTWTSFLQGYPPQVYISYFTNNCTDPNASFFTAGCITSTVSAIWHAACNFTGNLDTSQAIQEYEDPSCENWFTMAPYYAGLFNTTYFTSEENYECVSLPLYQWGFSYAFLLVTSCINGFWLLGTWLFWADAQLHSELTRKRRRLGLWRAILDISESIKKDLGPNSCAYANEELDCVMKKRKYRVRYAVEEGDSGLPHIGLSSAAGGAARVRLDWGQEYGEERI